MFSKFTMLLLTLISTICVAQQTDVVKHPDYSIDSLIAIIHANPNARLNTTNSEEVHVPIQVHIVKDKFGNTPNYESILSDFQQLNQYFAPINMSFFFCGPFNVIDNPDFYTIEGTKLNEMVSTYNLPSTLDIFYVGEIDQCSWCGIAYLGFSMGDVILIKNQCIGSKTLTHEIGHYFGLDHPHDNQFGNEFVDGSNCTTAGDKLCDTPAEPVLLGKVDYNCKYIGTDIDSKGAVYKPNVDNIMSYGPDACANKFTPQQYSLMSSVYNTKHKSVLTCTQQVDFNIKINNKLTRLNKGQQNTIPVYITNFSPVPFTGEVSYKISMLDNAGRETVLLTDSKNKVWTPFLSDTIDVLVTIPLDASEGMYAIKAEVNNNKAIFETNYTNNTVEKRLGVYESSTLLPDLEITVIATPVHEVGYQKTFTLKIKNKGNADLKSNYGLITHISNDQIPSGDDIIENQSYGSILKVGQTDSFTVSLNFPGNIDLPVYVIVMVDMESNIAESNEDNNMFVTKIVPQLPVANKWKYDLFVSGIEGLFDPIPDTLYNLSSFYFSVKIKDQGDIKTFDYSKNPESHLRFAYGAIYLSTDNVWSNDDILLGKKSDRLYMGSGSLSIWTDIPSNIANGSYYLIGVVDPNGYLVETNENNNTFSKPIQIKQGYNPDLIFAKDPIVKASVIDYNTPFLFESEIKNQGYGPSKKWDIVHYLSIDPYVNYNDKSIDVSYTQTLSFEANTTKTLNMNLTVATEKVPEGYYYLISCLRNHSGTEYSPNNCYINPKQLLVGNNVSKIAAIEPNRVKESFNLIAFPNPANETLRLQLAQGLHTISLTDNFGKVVYLWSSENPIHETEINTSTIPAGLYHLKYSSSSQNGVTKIVIIH